jgi:hypothetical protein
MGRKLRELQKQQPHYNLTPNQTVVLLNAQTFSQWDPASKSRPNWLYADKFVSLANHYDQNQKKKTAFKKLEQWKLPGFSIPYGVAKYLLSNEFYTEIASELGLIDQVRRVASLHQEDCPHYCTALVHPGQEEPDCSSIAMICASSQCMSNYSAVISTAPPSAASTVGSRPSCGEPSCELPSCGSTHNSCTGSAFPFPFDNEVNIYRYVYNPKQMCSCTFQIHLENKNNFF